MNELFKRPCPKCGKKGLHYAGHPHAFGYKDTTRLVCRFCGEKFKITTKTANTDGSAEQEQK